MLTGDVVVVDEPDVRPTVELEDFDASLFELRLGRGGTDVTGFVTPKSAPNDNDELTADNVALVEDFRPKVFTAFSVENVGIIGELDSDESCDRENDPSVLKFSPAVPFAGARRGGGTGKEFSGSSAYDTLADIRLSKTRGRACAPALSVAPSFVIETSSSAPICIK